MQIVVSILLVLWAQLCIGQISPEQYFGDSYYDALNYCRSKKELFYRIGKEYNVNPIVASSIVFPELIRYNRFRDFAETTALEVLYIQYGKKTADFSIGRFQIKPSFVEELEKLASSDSLLNKQFYKIIQYNTTDTINIRKIRLERLKSESWQFIYLVAFTRIAQRVYSDYLGKSEITDLRLLSSAYNRGLTATFDELSLLANKKSFPYSNLSVGRYSYYDVANHYYTNYSHKIFKP